MSDYQQLAARFDEVRSSWKRTAALSGLAVVVTEGIGILTVMLFLDWLYQPRPLLRLSMWAVALAGVLWLVMRHVLSPLSRKIPDEQIALYIEEHRNDLDGMLITAAEYGQKRAGHADSQAALIDAVVNEAAAKVGATIRKVVDLARLKKYGIGAVAGIGLYIVLSALFPNAVGHHLGRILQPWLATEEDLPKHAPGAVVVEPITFTLSKGDTSLERGTSFDFEAVLSRTADKPVVLHFRPRAQGDAGAWQTLPMTEIEKLNGYQGSLSDVSEDLEFYVSCGADKSETHRLAVFDPLIVRTFEATTHYPAYLKLPDRIENPSTGDVEAVVGSTVTVRINASTPLKEGQIKWSNGQTQPLTVDALANTGATFTFEVKEDGTYDYALADANGQKAVSTASLSVKAIPDTPPTITVNSPQSPVMTNPIGEVKFDIEAGDDFGVAGVDLVYSRLDAQGKQQETRVPLKLEPGDTKATPNAMHATYNFMLEDTRPPFQSEEAIPYHLEARDAKGQVTPSEIGFIIVGYYESWGTWGAPHGSETATHVEGPDLMAILSLTWMLDGQKKTVAPADYLKQSKDIAAKMEDNGQLREFVNLEEMPQLAKVKDIIDAHAGKARDALAKGDTPLAVVELSTAAALYAGNGILEDASLAKHAASQITIIGEVGFKPPALTMLEQARLDALNKAAADKTHQEQEKKDAGAAGAASKEIEDLMKKQDEIVKKAQSKTGAESKSSEGEKSDLAKAQNENAEKAKAAAEKAKSGAASKAASDAGSKVQDAADKTAAAAKTMQDAAKDFANGKNAEGAAKAAAAKKALQDAHDTLQDTSRDKLEAAISETAARAAALIEKQKGLRTTGTEIAAKELDGGKKPDQRQARDLQKQAYQQTELRADAETLNSDIANLAGWAAQVGQDEAIRELGEAQKTIKRGQPEAKMGNAVIDLNNATPAPAIDEQKKAEDALAKILDNLHNSSDALAASKDAQLNRAQRTVEEIKKGLEKIAPAEKGGEKGAGAEAKAGEKSGDKAGEKGNTGAQAKAGEKAGDKAGEKGNTGAQAKAGEKAGEQPGEKGTTGAQAKAGEKAGEQPGEKGTTGAQAKAGEKAGEQPGEKGTTGAQAKAGEKAGNEPGEKGNAGAQAKAGNEPGAQAKTGNEPGAQAKAGEQPGTQPGEKPGEKAGDEANAKPMPGQTGQPTSGGGPSQPLQKLTYDLQRLAATLDNRDLVPQKEVDRLKEMSMDTAELEKRLAVDPKLVKEVSGIVETISDKLEAETAVKTEAGKLFSSQREECPPAYRQFVNQYFEALSQMPPAPGQAAKP